MLLSTNRRYSWFGIRFNKGLLYEDGGRPVIYGNTDELKRILNLSEHWRIVKLDLNDSNEIVDWSHEREWHYQGNYGFEFCEIEKLVKNYTYYKKLIDRCIEENRLDIFKEVNGIVPLNSVVL